MSSSRKISKLLRQTFCWSKPAKILFLIENWLFYCYSLFYHEITELLMQFVAFQIWQECLISDTYGFKWTICVNPLIRNKITDERTYQVEKYKISLYLPYLLFIWISSVSNEPFYFIFLIQSTMLQFMMPQLYFICGNALWYLRIGISERLLLVLPFSKVKPLF